MATVAIEVSKLDFNQLPGVAEFADALITDTVRREEDPEAYDAAKTYMVGFMAEMNDGDDPLPLGFYSPYAVAFITGYQAARSAYRGGHA